MSTKEERTREYVSALMKHVSKGRLDNHLQSIADVTLLRLRHIREETAARNKAEMVPGTRVQITGNIKPRYLYGLKGTVVDETYPRQTDKVLTSVKLDKGRVGRYGPIIFVPSALVHKLKDQTPHPDHTEVQT